MFVTTCEDKTIRFWDLENKRQKNYIKIEEDIKPTSSTFSINEDIFAVGFNTGNIKFYSSLDFHLERELVERKFPINVIKYSKDDKLVAFATNDERGNNIIDIYYTSSYNKYGTLTGAQKQINGFDWSSDGKYIACYSHEKECRIFSVIDKFMISNYNDVDNQEWYTWSISYGWPLKGYYDNKENKAPIYSCERFKLKNDSNFIIATGGYDGGVRLYKYPIANKSQRYIKNIIEHGDKITNVKFGKVGEYEILITSGSDGCLIAWKIEQI